MTTSLSKSLFLFYAIAVSLAVISTEADAQPIERLKSYKNGNQLLEDCSATLPDPSYWQKQASCMSYVAGVLDGLAAAQQVHELPTPFCVPLNANLGQLADIVKISLQNNPKSRHLGASGRVFLALREAYPC
jgi:hypothetical protein